MKILQSYWSKPLYASRANGINERYFGGWPKIRYHYFSWALSCLLFRRFYPDVELITDAAGKEELIDRLGLPYTHVTACLDEINDYPPELWAIGKIYAYQSQQLPFLHADGDVFIWQKFPPELEQAPLLAQSLEVGFTHYGTVLDGVHRHFDYIPAVLAHRTGEAVRSINAGIIGGTDFQFYRAYATEALEFINRNRHCLHQVDTGLFNQIYEQYLFTCLAAEHKIDIQYFLPEMDEEFTQVLNFHLLPSIQSYIHVVGKAKRDSLACRQVEFRLRHEFPDYYQRVLDFLGEKDHARPVVHYPASKTQEKDHIANWFPRTFFLLNHLKDEKTEVITFNTLEEVIGRVGKEDLAGLALQAIFNLEKKRYELHQEKMRGPAPDAFCEMARVYRFLEGNDIDQLLQARLVLHPDAKIVKVDWYLPAG